MLNADRQLMELIASAQAGDDDAMGELLDAHRPYLDLLAQRSLSPEIRKRVGGSDVVQLTCLAVVRALSQANFESPDQFIAWLRRIHQNQVTDVYRQHAQTRGRDVANELQLEHIDAPDLFASTPSQRMMAAEAAAALSRAIAQLPESQREAIRLKYLEGLTVEETAETLSASKFAVAGLLHRGMVRLKDIFRVQDSVL